MKVSGPPSTSCLPASASNRKGLTLIELTVALAAALMIASVSLTVLSQQVTFTRMMTQQAFLLEEAPMVNNLLSRILGQIDGYRIYPSRDAAAAGGTSVLADGKAIVLSFRSPTNEFRFAMLAFETGADGVGRLGFYNRTGNSWPDTPDWVVTDRATDVTFLVEQGVLRLRLDGPNDERITYSGHFQS